MSIRQEELFIGTAEVDITPGKGLFMAGSLDPENRRATGTHDPLYVRAIVLESNGKKLAYVAIDIIALISKSVEKYVRRAALETGIPEDNIIWSCSHTHSGPYSLENRFSPENEALIDYVWLNQAMEKFVACIKEAASKRVPARMSRMRGFHNGILHNRRIRFKNQYDINTWLLDNAGEIQSIGSSGPVDPEIGILAFDDEKGNLLAVMYQFTLHANARGGLEYSADFPGVVAKRIKNQFGNGVAPLFMPGACGDINPTRSCDETGNALADVICQKLSARVPVKSNISLGVRKQYLTVPLRDLNINQEERLKNSKWGEVGQKYLRKTAAEIRDSKIAEIETSVQTWHIGDVAFASNPGELFVGQGIRIKEESPFPWTYPVELSGDWIGYLITPEAMKHGGYEAITSFAAPVSVEGVDMIIKQSIRDLNILAKEKISGEMFPVIERLNNGNEMVIRPLRKDDGEALADFYLSIPKEDYFFYCPHPLDKEHACKKADDAENPNFICLVMGTKDGKIAGYAWCRWPEDWIKSSFGICIRHDHHGIGAGQALMRNLIGLSGKYGPPIMSLTVQKANPGAVKLYQKMGFNVIREQIRVRDNEPEYYMELDLKSRQ